MNRFISMSVLIALVAAAYLPAQAITPWVEDFELTFPPSGWTLLNPGSGGTWLWGWQPAPSGTHSAEMRPFWNNGMEDGWLITPAFEASDEPYLLLDFQESGRFWSEGGGTHEILVSTTVADDPAAFTSVWQMEPSHYEAPWLDSGKDQWSNVHVDLSQYAGQTIHVAFRYFSEISTDYWWVDCVRLRATSLHDVRTLAAFPDDETWLAGNEITPSMVVENTGPYAETFPVEMIIEHDGTTVYSETVQVTDLAPGASTTVEFPPFICETGSYLLRGTALVPEDGDPADNTKTAGNIAYTCQRTPLGILFTNWACGPCVGANQAMDNWFPQNDNNASLMRVHVHWPSNQDPMYRANPAQSEYLREMHPELINSVPWLYLDNEYSVPATQNSDWPTFIADGFAQRRLFVGTPLEVDVVFDPADSTARVTLDIIDPMPAGSFNLYVAITEDHIYAPGSNGEEYHHQAFRWLFPGESGVPVSSAVGTHQYVVDLALYPDWAYENLSAIAWVQQDSAGVILNSATAKIGGVSAVEQPQDIPLPRVQLSAFPNPFNPRTTVHFGIPESGAVNLSVYDVSGRLVTTLLQGQVAAGEHEVPWNGLDATGRSVSSGVYFARLDSGGHIVLGRMTLIR